MPIDLSFHYTDTELNWKMSSHILLSATTIQPYPPNLSTKIAKQAMRAEIRQGPWHTPAPIDPYGGGINTDSSTPGSEYEGVTESWTERGDPQNHATVPTRPYHWLEVLSGIDAAAGDAMEARATSENKAQVLFAHLSVPSDPAFQ
ncbi:uncharacterized protein KD926_000076 [Aspergillus affinis]|uniref:uncharacterized protein n=1 Tax=Aspergillus affinis TaxID=1070780 RepID=UPI0022FE7707|nr:uncharacterized protein KD926_000076 [Aspergillus affinis]KAI9037735.1 hypothetical protein KD926_000076 [Aspergillus affinis]